MRFLPAGLVALLFALPLPANPPKEPAPKPPSVDELVADLGHPVFGVREKAQRELWLRGEEAIPALEKAAKGDDPEAAQRARELLDKFAWGILPDTPPAVLKLIRQYQAGDPKPDRAEEVRKEAIAGLLKHGRTGVSVVRAILKKDLPLEARARLTTAMTALVRREVPVLLVAGKTEEADELVSLHASGTTREGDADFAVYHALRATLPAAIARAEALVKSGRRPTDAKFLLTHLHRAAGQWAKAREVAADLPPREEEASFKEILLEDEGNWSALADLSPGREFNHPDAVRLTLLRLAGRKEKFDAAAKQVRADADEYTSQTDIMDTAVALLANHRADDATDLLLEKKKNLGLLSEILIARKRYKEALDLVGGGAKEKETIGASDKLDFNLRRARVLMMTGHKDDAVQLFEQVARDLLAREGRRAFFDTSARSLIRTEIRLGLRDLACEHAALFVPPEGRAATTQGESPFELLFPNDPIAAEALFAVLRAKKVPGDAPGPTMLRTRDVLTGAAGKAAVDEAVQLLRESAGKLPNDGVVPDPGEENSSIITFSSSRMVKARRYFTLGMVLRAAKRIDDAEAAFKQAAALTEGASDAARASGARSWVYGAPDPARVWIEWGEMLADAGRHREAAAVFEAGWKLFPDQPLPLYLNGQALTKAGDAKEGARRVELSHWVSLGNEKVRGRFLDELVRRGESKAIRREVALILRACWSHDHYFGNVMNQCARGAALTGDFAQAEMCGQRSLLVVLRHPGVYFVDTSSYLGVPHDLLIYHARAMVNAGKINEAMVAAREVLAITPGHLELVTGIVPNLDHSKHKREADELFASAWAAYEKMLKDYPNSPAARHGLAALAGHCNRKLDDGLKHAKAAVASDPGSPQYREALAEVHFRRGERDDAVKVMQKLADEQPRNPLYRRQLTRYRTAAFDSPWPYTTE
jgi:tetratricopeptide (TPR) repeat protein